MGLTLADLRRKSARGARLLQRFLNQRQAAFAALDDQSHAAHSALFVPHRNARPAEYVIQRRLALHPALPLLRDWADDARTGCGDDVPHAALLLWAESCLSGDRSQASAAAELWALDQRPTGIGQVACDVLNELIAAGASPIPALPPAAVSFALSLATCHEEAGGPAWSALLESAVRALEHRVAMHEEGQDPMALTMGALAWRALDAGVLDASRMRDFVEQEPHLTRVLEADVIYSGTRVSCRVAPGSPGETLLRELCCERLAAMTDASTQHAFYDGPFKSISLWPGHDVLVAALKQLDRIRSLSRDDFQTTPASSLWHVLRNTRLDEDSDDDNPGGVIEPGIAVDRALLQAAVVAPWLAGPVAQACNTPGLESAVAWIHAHSRSAMSTADATPDCPRVQRQVLQMVARVGTPHARLTPAERDSGVLEREWWCAAANSLADDALRVVLQAMPLAFRHQTWLADAARALLGLNTEEVRTGAADHKAASVRLLGALPLDDDGDDGDGDGAVVERLQWLAEFANAESGSAQRRLADRRTATVAMANLASAADAPDAVWLAWQHGRLDWPAPCPTFPVRIDAWDCRLVLDGDGQPTIEVQRTDGDKPLRAVPRELASRPEFRLLRQAVRDQAATVEAIAATLQRHLLPGRSIRASVLRRQLDHAVCRAMLGACVVESGSLVGWPEARGSQLALRDLQDAAHQLPDDAEVRLAHPLELRTAGTLAAWQDQLMARGWQQPVAQLFRPADLRLPSAGLAVRVVPAVERLRQLGWTADDGLSPRRVIDGRVASWPFDGDPLDLFSAADATTGELTITPMATDIPPRVLAEAAHDVMQAIAAASSPAAWPLPLVDARLEVLRRILGHRSAFRSSQIDVSFTRERLQLVVTLPAGPKSKATRGKKKAAASAGRAYRQVSAWIDIRTGSAFVGSTLLDLPDAKKPLPAVWPHPPDASEKRLLAAWWNVVQGVEQNSTAVLSQLVAAT